MIEGHEKKMKIQLKATILANSLLDKVNTKDLVETNDSTPVGKYSDNIDTSNTPTDSSMCTMSSSVADDNNVPDNNVSKVLECEMSNESASNSSSTSVSQ